MSHHHPTYSELFFQQLIKLESMHILEEGGNNRGEIIEAMVRGAVKGTEHYALYAVHSDGSSQAREWCYAFGKGGADVGVQEQTGIPRAVHDEIMPATLSTRLALEHFAERDALLAPQNRLEGDLYPGMPVFFDRPGGKGQITLTDKQGTQVKADWKNHVGFIVGFGEENGEAGFYALEGNKDIVGQRADGVARIFYPFDDPSIIAFADVNKIAGESGHYAAGQDIAGRRTARFERARQEAQEAGIAPFGVTFDALADEHQKREGHVVPLPNPVRYNNDIALAEDGASEITVPGYALRSESPSIRL